MYITQPSSPSWFDFHDNALATSSSVKVPVRDLVWPEDLAPIMKGLKFTHVSCYILLLYSRILDLKLYWFDFQMGLSRGNAPRAFLSLALISFCAPISLLMTLLRCVKSSKNSSGSPAALN